MPRLTGLQAVCEPPGVRFSAVNGSVLVTIDIARHTDQTPECHLVVDATRDARGAFTYAGVKLRQIEWAMILCARSRVAQA